MTKAILTAFATAGALVMLTLPAGAMTLAEAKAAGKLRVGIQADNCPWGCLSSTGEAQGFDAEIARALAKSLGVEVQFFPLAVANRIPALTANKVDLLIASVGITPERAKSVQFSAPYAANTLFVTAPKDLALTKVEDLLTQVVGVPRAAPMDTILTREAPAGTEIRRFDDDSANIQALISGQVAAVGSNQFYIQRLEQAAPGVYENKFPIGQLYQGIATRLGEADWNTATNAFLKAFIGTPEYVAIHDQWLKVPVVPLPTEIPGMAFTVN